MCVKTEFMMCAKMKNLGIVFLSLFCAVLVAECKETHHIALRILEDQKGQYSGEDDFNNTSSETSSQNVSAIYPAPSTQVVPVDIETSQADDSKSSSVAPIVSTPVNITALLRSNTSNQISANVESNLNASSTNNSENGNNILLGDTKPLISEQNTTNAKNKPIDSEVKDLLDQDLPPKHDALVENHQHPMDPEEPLQIPDKIDKQTELIDDGQNTEDELRHPRHSMLNDMNEGFHGPGPVGVILVTAFVTLSVLCYAGLLLWRKYLERRYGSRTLLVDAEEFNDPSDMRHFSI